LEKPTKNFAPPPSPGRNTSAAPERFFSFFSQVD
jgi:hypothetical protein